MSALVQTIYHFKRPNRSLGNWYYVSNILVLTVWHFFGIFQQGKGHSNGTTKKV